MKNLKRIFVILLGMILVLGVSSAFIGCDKNTPDTFDVVIAEYDKERGEVSLNTEKTQFEKGEKVTITVTPNSESEIRSLYIDNANFVNDQFVEDKKHLGWSYDLNVYQDRTIYVTFQDRGVWDSDYNYSLDIEPYDTTKGKMIVTPDRAGIALGEEISVTITLNSDCVLKSFMVNGVDHKSKMIDNNYGVYTYSFTAEGNVKISADLSMDYTKERNVSASGFEAAINSNTLVLVDFWATWCGPCVQYLGPRLEALAKNGSLDGVLVVKVNTGARTGTASAEKKIAEEYYKKLEGGSLSLPFVVMFKNGQPKGSFTGAYEQASKQDEEILKFVKKYQ